MTCPVVEVRGGVDRDAHSGNYQLFAPRVLQLCFGLI